MLVNAMEVSGIEGNFRSTCELVMGKLRDNSDSMMAILEAFVHDPLMFWTLLMPEGEDDKEKEGGGGEDEQELAERDQHVLPAEIRSLRRTSRGSVPPPTDDESHSSRSPKSSCTLSSTGCVGGCVGGWRTEERRRDRRRITKASKSLVGAQRREDAVVPWLRSRGKSYRACLIAQTQHERGRLFTPLHRRHREVSVLAVAFALDRIAELLSIRALDPRVGGH